MSSIYGCKGKGIIAREPSVVAINTVDNMPIAYGEEARKMIGRTPDNIKAIKPLKHGVISNITITERMLKHFMEEAIESDAVFVMDSGRIVLSGKPNAVFSQVEMLANIGLRVPLATRLSYDLIKEGVPLNRGILDMETLAGELNKLKLNLK